MSAYIEEPNWIDPPRRKRIWYTDLPPDFIPPVISKERIARAVEIAHATCPNFTDTRWVLPLLKGD